MRELKNRTWKRAKGWLATGSSLCQQLTGIDDEKEEGATTTTRELSKGTAGLAR